MNQNCRYFEESRWRQLIFLFFVYPRSLALGNCLQLQERLWSFLLEMYLGTLRKGSCNLILGFSFIQANIWIISGNPEVRTYKQNSPAPTSGGKRRITRRSRACTSPVILPMASFLRHPLSDVCLYSPTYRRNSRTGNPRAHLVKLFLWQVYHPYQQFSLVRSALLVELWLDSETVLVPGNGTHFSHWNCSPEAR